MKTVLVLASLCLVSLALVPPAQADSAPSRDGLVGCQRDFSGGRAIAVPIGVGVLCVDPTETWCTVWIEWTAIPQTPTCLVAPIHAATAASIGPDSTPDVQCMDVYSETELAGGYWLVRRDSCSAEVFWCPEGYSPPAPPCQEGVLTTASIEPAVETPPVYCMPYERHIDLVPGLTIVQGGCGSYVRLCDQRVTSDPGTIDPSCLLATTTAAAAPEPNCLQVYRETTIGPVTYVQRDSCHSETYVCEDDDGVHESDETLKAFLNGQTTQPDHAALQDCVRDTLDDYIAWG